MSFARPTRAVERPIIKDTNYAAAFVRQSVPDPIRLLPGATTSVTVVFRNTGTATWKQAGAGRVGIYTYEPKYRISVFAEKSWISPSAPARLTTSVEPGAEGSFTFALHAPSKPGTYREHFYLAAENISWISKGYFYLDSIVTEPDIAKEDMPASEELVVSTSAAAVLSVPASNETSSSPASVSEAEPRSLIIEPLVRVGLLRTTSSVPVQVDFPYQLYVGNEFYSMIPASTTAVVTYQDGYETVSFNGTSVSTTAPLRFVPVQPNDYFILPNNERRIKGRKYAFNAYRGTLEIRFSPKTSSTVVINELPLDWYVAGITETWDGAPYEYIKALLVAARSYAYYQLEHEKPKDSLFDVYASTNDQLYLGYDAELSMPHVAQAERETYGEMVTYQGTPVITPYSSRTNGKTRTWKQAWGGTDKPWLQSVAAKYDAGLARLGHGVGMSNHDAELRAQKDAWNYQTILKYYYSGTNVEKIY